MKLFQTGPNRSKKKKKNQFPRELNEVIPNNTSSGGVVRIRINFLSFFLSYNVSPN
jgi:hypothetical protein